MTARGAVRAGRLSAGLGLAVLALVAGCVAVPVILPTAGAEPLRVSGPARPFAQDEGMLARTTGEAMCRARGQQLQTSIYDRYEAGAWVFVEGCA